MSKQEYISIRGAAVNNLKGVDSDIPRGKLCVITGVSGSGKTSLAFDTLFAEGQRRFAESISSFARQFLGRMSKPAVEKIEGIPPAIAIEQKVNTRNPRSTVGSTTEIYDYLRVLYARIGRTYSPISGKEVKSDSLETVLDFLKESHCTAYILADLKWEEEKFRVERLLNLKEDGFSRVYITQTYEYKKIDTILSDITDYSSSNVALLIDRIALANDEDTQTRLADSIRTAFEKGDGKISIVLNEPSTGENNIHHFSSLFEADGISFEQPQEWLFNFNNPLGACPVCGGYGQIIGLDETLIIPNTALSLYQGAIACWRGETMSYFKERLIISAAKYNIPIHKPYHELTTEQKDIIWEGNNDIIGILPFFKELESKKYKIQNKYMISRYSGKTTCRECHGDRLKKEALYVKVGGKNIAELMRMSIASLQVFFRDLSLTEHEKTIASRLLKEITRRIDYLADVGLPYLTLNRKSNTLSGGESQRVNLVSSLGNVLTGSMYILDEPTIGLHPRDTARLISVMKNLRDLGNTVIVVEHDEEIIRAADLLIDIGPEAGVKGGEIVYQGAPPTENESINSPYLSKSLTLQYLMGRKKIEIPSTKREWNYYIEIKGACENNLKNIDVKFPLRVMTAVTGVSGSGKSTLVGEILYPALKRHISQFGNKPGAFRELCGDLHKITNVEYIDQNPIGRSSRSNPVTYLKVYDDIRKLYSDQPYAKMNGYGHSHFSFNIDGGRCPDCQGEGVIKIPMQFMADITTVCETCSGKRFQPDILEVKYRGMNIYDVLEMTVDEAIEFFGSQKDDTQALKIAENLKPLQYVGLDYIKLGQSSSTLSGGESQRVKLASYLGKDSTSKENGSILFIFDEPTTGLHFDDISKLLKSFYALLDRGHSIIVVEHNPYIIAAADHIIELGPEGGDLGGYLIQN